jgi:hypothetical protein
MERQIEVPMDRPPEQWVTAMAITGAMFGAGVPLWSTFVRRRGIVPGAAYGVAVYAGSEALFHVVASARTVTWARDPHRGLPPMAAAGAVFGWIDSLIG